MVRPLLRFVLYHFRLEIRNEDELKEIVKYFRKFSDSFQQKNSCNVCYQKVTQKCHKIEQVFDHCMIQGWGRGSRAGMKESVQRGPMKLSEKLFEIMFDCFKNVLQLFELFQFL